MEKNCHGNAELHYFMFMVIKAEDFHWALGQHPHVNTTCVRGSLCLSCSVAYLNPWLMSRQTPGSKSVFI